MIDPRRVLLAIVQPARSVAPTQTEVTMSDAIQHVGTDTPAGAAHVETAHEGTATGERYTSLTAPSIARRRTTEKAAARTARDPGRPRHVAAAAIRSLFAPYTAKHPALRESARRCVAAAAAITAATIAALIVARRR